MSSPTPDTTYQRFNRQFFKDLYVLTKPFWTSKEKKRGFFYLFINLMCSLGGVYASVALNSVSKDMYDALAAFNKQLLMSSCLQFFGLAGLVFVCAGYGSYFSGLLTIHWQRWLTEQNIDKWLDQQAHYRMRWLKKRVDNPDQRISEDLASFPALTLKIFFLLLQSVTSYISFSLILWNLSRNFPLVLAGFHVTIPGYLFFAASIYGILGLWCIGMIGKKLAGIEYLQQLFNANFRHQLIQIREYSEQIASFRGEKNEQTRLNGLFSKIFGNYIQANALRKNLLFFTIGYDIFTQIVAIFLAMPLFFAKRVQLGGMVQISGAFRSVVQAFSSIVEAFSYFAEWKAVIYRLTEFDTGIALSQQVNLGVEKQIDSGLHSIALSQLKIEFPNHQLMSTISDMQFLAPHRYLISGATGSGKSTLLKVLMDLWPNAKGKIRQPSPEQMFLLPQRCYIPDGSLKDVLTYPDLLNINDKSVIDLMMQCGLESFIPDLHEVRQWSQVLSLGQQQLVGFVRLFLRCPQVILLDESTAALDETSEARMYRMLNAYFPEALVISIGHRSSLVQYHNYQLTLNNHQFIPVEKTGVLA